MKEEEILQKLKEQSELVKAQETITVNGKPRTVNRDNNGRFANKSSRAYRYRPVLGMVPSSPSQSSKPKDRRPEVV